jgi:predicted heme/steroid binding protein
MPVIQTITTASGTSAYVPTSRQLTINGVTYDLTADRSWTIEVLDNLIANAPLSYNSGTNTISISQSGNSTDGYLSSADWLTFSSKQNAITLTTTGNNGAATLVGATLNIPEYTLAGLGGFSNPMTSLGDIIYGNAVGLALRRAGNTTTTKMFLSQTGDGTNSAAPIWSVVTAADTGAVPTTRTLTINGTSYDLSANRSWSVGTVTSVDISLPTGLSVSGNPITTSGTLAVTFTAGYSIPTTAKQTEWDSAYTNRITSLTTTGTSGAATLSSNTLNIPIYQAQGNYLTGLSGEATSSGYPTASVTLTNSAVIAKVLTGLSIIGGTIASTDSILTAFGKIQNQVNALVGGVMYQGTWNASTNTPTLTSSTGTKGYYYVVSVAGSTNLDGITDWKLGDWAIYNGASWEKVDNTDAVVSVNGYTGAVVLTTSDVAEGTNLYFTNTRAQNAITLTTTGSSGTSTYTSGTLNIPNYTLSGLGGVPSTRTLTINGTAYDLSADRSWSVGTVTSVAALTIGTTGTDITSSVANGTTTPVITLNIPTASATNRGALSSTDWSTFNAKEPAITAGTTSQYFRGDKTFQTLNTTAVTEATNLYYTDARARLSLSFTAGSGAYNSTTGVITIPTNTNQLTNGAAFITLTSLSAGTGISYNNTTGVITSTITQYTDALARASISETITGIDYNNTTGVFSITSGYGIPTTTSQTNWDTAYTNRITSLTTTGSSGAATLISNTLNIPNYTAAGLGAVPTSRTITINDVVFDLSANRSWSVGDFGTW